MHTYPTPAAITGPSIADFDPYPTPQPEQVAHRRMRAPGPPPHALEQTLFDKAVPIGRCFVAPYGRPFSQQKVDGLVRHWDERALGTIYLSFRYDMNSYAIIDGQHRIGAAQVKGLTVIPARIYIDLSYEEEAHLYNLFATVNKQTALDRFRAKLEAQDNQAYLIRSALRTHGLDVAIHSNHPGNVQAVNVLETIASHYGISHLEQVISILHEAWGTAPRAWIGEPLLGMAQFLHRYKGEANIRRLIDRLKLRTPEDMIARAHAVKGGLERAEGKSSYGIALLYVYNDGLRTNRLGDWKKMVYTDTARAEASERLSAVNRNLTAGQRREIGRKGNAKLTPEERSARTRKANTTRRTRQNGTTNEVEDTNAR